MTEIIIKDLDERSIEMNSKERNRGKRWMRYEKDEFTKE